MSTNHSTHGLPAEVNCRGGYPTAHAVLVLLHLVVLVWFLSHRISKVLRALFCSSSAVSLSYHTLIGGICWSPSISASARVHFTSPHPHVPVLHAAVLAQIHSLIAMHFIMSRPQRQTIRLAKLAFLSFFALMNAVGFVCLLVLGIADDTAYRVLLPSTALLGCAVSLLRHLYCLLLFSETKSRAVAFLIYIPLLFVAIWSLSWAFPTDSEARLFPSQLDDLDAQPHWSIVLRAFLLDARGLAVKGIVSKAIIASSQRPQQPLRVLAADLTTVQLTSFKWGLLSAIVAMVAYLSVNTQTWHLTLPTKGLAMPEQPAGIMPDLGLGSPFLNMWPIGLLAVLLLLLICTDMWRHALTKSFSAAGRDFCHDSRPHTQEHASDLRLWSERILIMALVILLVF